MQIDAGNHKECYLTISVDSLTTCSWYVLPPSSIFLPLLFHPACWEALPRSNPSPFYKNSFLTEKVTPYWLMVPLSHSYTASLLMSVNYASFLKCEQVNGGALVCWLMWQFVILCAKFLSHVKILVMWLKKKEIWNTFSVCWVRQIVCKIHLSPSMHFLNPEFQWKHPQRRRGGLSGREKRWQKFSRTGEREPGMLLLMNQLQGSVEWLSLIGHKNMRKKYFCAQLSETSFFCHAALVIFLYGGVYLQTQLFIIIIIIITIIIIVISIN